ncbi:hypothetical protein A2U01_0085371, partial [Trifolium medium]|nr:hypothetical protein [Trifolium medium]
MVFFVFFLEEEDEG